jgi:hypothetical protein
MRKQKAVISLAVSLIIILCIAGILLAFAGGPPTGRTGSVIFGESSCAASGCHVGTANSGSGTLTLSGVPANYTLGQAYTLTVTLQQTGQRRWGFQLSARARSSGNSVGTLSSLDGFSQLQTGSTGIQYIAHNADGTRAGTVNGPVSFSVRWTAPASNVGEVVFSVAGNAANNDNNNTGDFIYTRETSSQPPGSQAGPTITSIIPNSGPVNGGTPVIITGTGFQSGATVSIGGVAATNVSVAGSTQINATTGAAGTPGTVNVVVTNPGNQSATLTNGFTYSSSAGTPAPTATAIFLPFVVDTAAFRNNLIMSNQTGSAANVTVQLIEAGGTILATKSYTIPANGLFQQNGIIPDLMGQASPANKQGYLILESSQQITAASTPIDNVTQDSSVIQGTRGVSSHLLSPTSASVGVFKTTMTIINDSGTTNNIEIKLKFTDGSVTATQNVTIAPYGFFHSEDIHNFLGVSGTFGPIELTSKNAVPMPFLAVSRVYATITTSNGSGQTSSFFSAIPF